MVKTLLGQKFTPLFFDDVIVLSRDLGVKKFSPKFLLLLFSDEEPENGKNKKKKVTGDVTKGCGHCSLEAISKKKFYELVER